jgi:RNA polymerase-binding transcription factor DksA
METTNAQTQNAELKKNLNQVKDQIDTWIGNVEKAGDELVRAVREERHENTISNCIATLRMSQTTLNRLFTRRQDLQMAKNALGICHECGHQDESRSQFDNAAPKPLDYTLGL